MVLGVLSTASGQPIETALRSVLSDLWDGSWIRKHLRTEQKIVVKEAVLNNALSDHKNTFKRRSAVDREWQLAEIRAVITEPDRLLKYNYPFVYDKLVSLNDSLVEVYTQLHEDLFDRDTQWERLRSQVFIDYDGKTARSGKLLANAINYILERDSNRSEEDVKKEVMATIERRIQDYLFAFNNGTATNRRNIHAAWQQDPIALEPAGTWQLGEQSALHYTEFQESYLSMIDSFKSDLEYAFNNPKFVSRRGISPAVGDILQLLSENYFEYETYTRWFSQNETLMNEALVIVDMRTRATPHEIVKLDPTTLEPTDLNEGLKETEFVDTITEKRRELLTRYLAIREEVTSEIEEQIINRKKLLSPEEEEVLWREYQHMKDLTR